MQKWYFRKRVWIPVLVVITLTIYLFRIVFISDIAVTKPNVNHKALNSFEVEQDTLHDYLGNELVVMELGRLVVPEDRSNPESNHIEIYFERMKSTSENPLAPIFFLAGGPGSSATQIARTEYFYLFKELSKYADVVLIDQRGTGNSIPNLHCRNSLDTPTDITTNVQEQIFEDILEKCKECHDEFRDMDIELKAYNSYESVLDIEAVRETLGYKTLNLYGYSYGSELAQIYIRHFESKVDKAILAAPLAPDHGLKLPLDIQYQVAYMDSLIKQDKRLSKYIPNYVELVQRVHEKLQKEPQFVQTSTRGAFGEDLSDLEKIISDIVVAFKPTFDLFLTDDHLQMMVSDQIGIDRAIKKLPSIYYNIDQGNYEEVGLGLRNFSRRRMPNALFFTVNGASGYSKARWEQALTQESQAIYTHFGISYSRFPEVYEAFGIEKIKGMNAPVYGNTNTLLIGGTLDGRTPPKLTQDIANRFPNHLRINVENAGHNGLLNTEIMHGIIAFMQDSLTADLDLRSNVAFEPVVPYAYSIRDTIFNSINDKGTQAGISLYKKLYTDYNSSDDYVLDFSVAALDTIYDLLVEEKNYEAAIELFIMAKNIFPDNAVVYRNLGEAYSFNNKNDEALSNIINSLRLDFFDGKTQALFRKLK